MAKIKVAVLGTGSLGQHHARIYSELAALGEVELTGIYDAHAETAQKIAEKHKLRVFSSIAEAAENSDALNIVTPTTTHFEIARQLLAQGKHVLVEKPMTDNSAQAAELIEIAREKNCVLQVGHVERFNPVFKFLETVATEPRFIECQRLSPFPARSTDIGVVLDLMIHDLDIVLALVKSPVTGVEAVGAPVLSRSEDIANARLKFANGCIANITASRVSEERLRKISVFNGAANPCFVSLDFRSQEGFIYRVANDGENLPQGKIPAPKDSTVINEFAGKKIVRESAPIAKDEPLKLELQHFVQCVRDKKTPMVSGESAKRALDLAFEITRQIQQIK
ncbi:MAG TPA: Gfo/Idh/MocA family oxidoreductase [Verrucomicrobiae bacterium]|jgi:predicted dehydrogenase|nr:Gfo/Idh/MocA family oxidoreductase [Verrucomicrobiae bacterium]